MILKAPMDCTCRFPCHNLNGSAPIRGCTFAKGGDMHFRRNSRCPVSMDVVLTNLTPGREDHKDKYYPFGEFAEFRTPEEDVSRSCPF